MASGRRRRWRRCVWALLAQAPVAGVRISVDSSYIAATFSSRVGQRLSVVEKWRRALSNVTEALDVAGLASSAAGEIWCPWGGPAPDVPLTAGPDTLNTFDYTQYDRQQSASLSSVVSGRIKGHDWTTVARQAYWSESSAHALWDRYGEAWVAQQNVASEIFSRPVAEGKRVPEDRLSSPEWRGF